MADFAGLIGRLSRGVFSLPLQARVRFASRKGGGRKCNIWLNLESE